MSEDDLFSHIGSLHLSEFFRGLTYEEHRDREPTLPSGIYHCFYCSHYVKTDSLFPTTEIKNHIENNCIEAQRQKSSGPVKISFRVVTDIDEIRKNVIANLPHIKKCVFCKREFENPDNEGLLAHLKKEHKSSCFDMF